jgi:hypothetical protein
MGCSSSKNLPREEVVAVPRQNDVDTSGQRVYRENVRVENDAVYTGDMLNGLKDGQGRQACKSIIFT